MRGAIGDVIGWAFISSAFVAALWLVPF